MSALPSEKSMNFAIWTLNFAAFSWIFSCVSIWRISVLPEGSPTIVVPPPSSAIGLLPASWSRRMRFSAMKWPMCRLSAVASKPI